MNEWMLMHFSISHIYIYSLLMSPKYTWIAASEVFFWITVVTLSFTNDFIQRSIEMYSVEYSLGVIEAFCFSENYNLGNGWGWENVLLLFMMGKCLTFIHGWSVANRYQSAGILGWNHKSWVGSNLKSMLILP